MTLNALVYSFARSFYRYVFFILIEGPDVILDEEKKLLEKRYKRIIESLDLSSLREEDLEKSLENLRRELLKFLTKLLQNELTVGCTSCLFLYHQEYCSQKLSNKNWCANFQPNLILSFFVSDFVGFLSKAEKALKESPLRFQFSDFKVLKKELVRSKKRVDRQIKEMRSLVKPL